MLRIAGYFRVVQNFALFADRPASAKIKTAKIAASAIFVAPRHPVRAGAAKIKTAKISSRAIPRNFAPAKISRYTVIALLFHAYIIFTCTNCSYI